MCKADVIEERTYWIASVIWNRNSSGKVMPRSRAVVSDQAYLVTGGCQGKVMPRSRAVVSDQAYLVTGGCQTSGDGVYQDLWNWPARASATREEFPGDEQGCSVSRGCWARVGDG